MNLAQKQQPRRLIDTIGVAIAIIASLAIVYFATKNPIVTASFGAGLAVLGLIVMLIARPATGNFAGDGEALTDWSLTVAAIDQADMAIAITDRANRLVCANSQYEAWYGSRHAPPRLPVDQQSSDQLAIMARNVWRDGRAEPVTIAGNSRVWSAEAQRGGRAEDHLIWRFELITRPEPFAGAAEFLTGLFGRVLDDAGIAAGLVDPDGTILAANSALARRVAGDAKATLAGQDFTSLLLADDRDRIFFAREGAKGSPQTLVHIPLVDPDNSKVSGKVGAGDVPGIMMLIDAGVTLGGMSGDTRGQAAQLEALLEQLPLGLSTTDRDGNFLFANPAFRRAAGMDSEALPPYPSDLVVARDKTAISDAVRRFAQGPANNGDIAIRLGTQPDEPVHLGLAGVRGLGEAAVLLSLTDTSEETRLRRQVAQATKMQAVGQLAGGVAHDFNNVLTAIIGYCDLMLLRHTPGDSDYDDIQQIKANSNRAASLTRQLLAFSRQQTLQPETLQLPDILSEVSQLLKRLLGAKITLEVKHDRDLGAVRADPRQLEQVIINLAVNARDAIQSRGGGEGTSGTLTFTTRRVSAKDIRRSKSQIIPPGDYTTLIAQDTGGGISANVLGKVFEPFFTTKEQGKGTGLGLSTVYGIIKQSGGFIFATNVKGTDGKISGARFTVYLPVHNVSDEELKEIKALEQVAAKEPEREWAGGGNLLLVEDEDMVRAVAERALTRQGYSVTTASDGDEGLEIVEKGGKFDLVVSDVVMPSMDGPAMAREIRKLKPDMPILFMSGYAEAQLRDQIDIEAMHFIPKPFSVRQIADKVGEVLANARKGD